MSKADWLEIYRGYTSTELDAEMVSLKADLDGAYASQTSGSTSHQRNTAQLEQRLAAATRVKNERRGDWDAENRHGVVDFGGLSSEL